MTGRRFADAASHAALTLAAVVVLLPFVWIASAAFETQISLLTGQFWFKPVWSNFQEVLFSMTSDYLHDFMNSMIIGLCSTALVLVVATLAAYFDRAPVRLFGPRGDPVGRKTDAGKRHRHRYRLR